MNMISTNRSKLRSGLFLIAAWLSPGAAWCQEPPATVEMLWSGDHPVLETNAWQVCRIRDKVAVQVSLKYKEPLKAGDRLFTGACGSNTAPESTDLEVGLRCGDGTALTLSDAFDVQILEPGNKDCAAVRLNGTVDVLTDQPAVITSAGIPIGVEGTGFAVTQNPSASDTEHQFTCQLFDGRLRIGQGEKEATLHTGEVWSLDDAVVTRGLLGTASRIAASGRYARMDVATAWARGTLGTKPTSEAVEWLAKLHLAVLSRPSDDERRRTLASALSQLGLAERADFEAKRILNIDFTVDFAPPRIGVGQTTQATVRLRGLAEQTKPTCLRVQARDPSTIWLKGGDVQFVPIATGENAADQTEHVFELEGLKAGGSGIDIDILPYRCPGSY